MTRNKLARILDHSMLKPESTEREIRAGANIVRALGIGFYCVQPCWVRLAASELADTDAQVVSVVGFPHGCDVPQVKVRAALVALDDGAREIDMVMNFGALRSGHANVVSADIEAVVRAVKDAPVKVILEASALNDTEKRVACRLAVGSGAVFVKTSTGFHASGGATVNDVRLMREAVPANVGVKASGGIRTLAHAMAMIEVGANRIGTSASAAIIEACAELDAPALARLATIVRGADTV